MQASPLFNSRTFHSPRRKSIPLYSLSTPCTSHPSPLQPWPASRPRGHACAGPFTSVESHTVRPFVSGFSPWASCVQGPSIQLRSFSGRVILHCLNGPRFIYLVILLSHFRLGVVMNNAAANLRGQVFVCANVSNSFGYKASGVAGSYGSSV